MIALGFNENRHAAFEPHDEIGIVVDITAYAESHASFGVAMPEQDISEGRYGIDDLIFPIVHVALFGVQTLRQPF